MFKWLFSSRLGRTLLTAVFLTGSGTLIGIKTGGHLSPGPLSAAENGSSLGGYASHASFEQECTHCHAPMHCITADRCQSCHIDIAEQRQEALGLHGRLPATTQCQTCHIEHQGREAHITEISLANLDHHALAQFDLGQHQTNYDDAAMKCCDCHRDGRLEAAAVDCVTCHETADPVLMADHLTLYGPSCLDCHNGQGQMAGFDHATVYPLADAHAPVDCGACHENHRFAGTPQTCEGCHTEPDMHLGAFGTDCTRCHTTTAWAPARLVMHTFLLEHGNEGVIPCQTCHQESYTDYPCYACHDTWEIRLYHNQQALVTFENCIECHPTGRSNQPALAGPQAGNGSETAVPPLGTPSPGAPVPPATKVTPPAVGEPGKPVNNAANPPEAHNPANPGPDHSQPGK